MPTLSSLLNTHLQLRPNFGVRGHLLCFGVIQQRPHLTPQRTVVAPMGIELALDGEAAHAAGVDVAPAGGDPHAPRAFGVVVGGGPEGTDAIMGFSAAACHVVIMLRVVVEWVGRDVG